MAFYKVSIKTILKQSTGSAEDFHHPPWQHQHIISTTPELSANINYLQAPTLAGPPRENQRAGTLSCITPRQPTTYFGFCEASVKISFVF